MTRRLRDRLGRLTKDDAGLSMTELLVSALLTSIVLVSVATIFIQTTKLTTAAIQTRESNGVAANVSNAVTSVLGTATTYAKPASEIPNPAIVAGTRSSLSVVSFSDTSAANPTPAMVTFTRNSDESVSETRCTGVTSGGFWNFGSCSATSTRILGVGLLAPTSTADQLFTYRDANGTPFVIGTGSLTDTQKAQVASITVTVRVQAETAQTPAVIFSNTVVLRNLGLDSGL
jgi:hypothetical protein